MDAPDSLTSAADGMRLQAERLAVIGQNLANAATTGYHALETHAAAFSDGLHATISASGAEGPLRRTGVDTDLALVGSGYFAVATPAGVRYTRDGRMQRDAGGFLCDSRGHRILGSLGPVRFPSGARVDVDGRVSSVHVGADRLRIVQLIDPATDALGYAVAPQGGILQRAGARVQQGYLEDPSVDAIAEMTSLIATQRAFEANQKTIQRVDETLKRATTEVARARS